MANASATPMVPGEWEEAVARHGQRVLVALLARGLSLADARDAAQAAWERLIRQQRAGKLPRIELPGLVIRQALYLHGTRVRLDRLAPSNVLPLTLAPPSGEERLLAAVELEALSRALRELPSRVQEIFCLAFGPEAKSHEEIAAQVGLSTQRVKQIICEVRARLRAAREETSP